MSAQRLDPPGKLGQSNAKPHLSAQPLVEEPGKKAFLKRFELYLDSFTHEVGNGITHLYRLTRTEQEVAIFKALLNAYDVLMNLRFNRGGLNKTGGIITSCEPREPGRPEVATAAKELEKALVQARQLLIPDAEVELMQSKDKAERSIRCGLNLTSMLTELAEGKEDGRHVAPVHAKTAIVTFQDLGTQRGLKIEFLNADAERIALTIDRGPFLQCNPAYITLIAENMIANAKRALELNGAPLEIGLGCTSGGNVYRIIVTDKGAGMPAEVMHKLNSGARVTTKPAEEPGEHGIGFQYSRKLAELMGGRLYVEKSEPGLGTTVVLELVIQ